MAPICPKCNEPLKFWTRKPRRFPCPSCGTQLNVNFIEKGERTGHFFVWAIFGTILDMFGVVGMLLDFIWGAVLFSDHAHETTHVDFANAEEAAQARLEQADLSNKLRQEHAERTKGAAAGDAASQFKLGKAYEKGDPVEQSYSKAIDFFMTAAEQGYADAQSTLGRIHFMGQGTPVNFEEAYFWYSLAAKAGKPQEWAVAVARYLTPKQVLAVNERVEKWKPTSIKAK